MGKTILEINSSTVGSTGRIMFMVAEEAKGHGYTVYTASARHGNEKIIKAPNHIYVGNIYDKKIHLILAKITGYNGCFSHVTTAIFLRKLEQIKPDIIHIHNLHNCYINIPMFFHYVKRKGIPIVWTLHDCWPYTGHCPYYDYVGCEKWKYGCYDCPQYKGYPHSYIDRSRTMYALKKRWFTGANITVVTPSQWLANEVRKSFLDIYNIVVINNGIDLDIFRPRNSSINQEFGLIDKKIVLGVASSWAPRKGLDVFVKLSEKLPNDYKVVVIRVTEEQKNQIPKSILAISRTDNQVQLAEWYSAAYVFVIPTREENFPTTNIESLACGTQVITFRTGGSPEILSKGTGIVVEKENITALIEAILNISKTMKSQELCRKRAEIFSMREKYSDYINLFDKILSTVQESERKELCK